MLIAYGELADQRLRDNQIIAGQYLQNLPSKLVLGSALKNQIVEIAAKLKNTNENLKDKNNS